MPDVPLQAEAGVIARRLIGRDPTDAQRARYAEAIARRGVPLSAHEAELWRVMLRRPRLYDAVDAALALVRPASGIRQRGYMMLAVLEASPEHADLFLARGRSRTAVVSTVAASGVTGAVRAAVGLVVLAVTQ